MRTNSSSAANPSPGSAQSSRSSRPDAPRKARARTPERRASRALLPSRGWASEEGGRPAGKIALEEDLQAGLQGARRSGRPRPPEEAMVDRIASAPSHGRVRKARDPPRRRSRASRRSGARAPAGRSVRSPGSAPVRAAARAPQRAQQVNRAPPEDTPMWILGSLGAWRSLVARTVRVGEDPVRIRAPR